MINQDQEPSSDELDGEEQIRAKASPNGQPASRLAKARADALATYMGSLGGIPLFTPKEEKEAAIHLANLRLKLWESLLKLPKATQHLCALLTKETPAEIISQSNDLLERYQHAHIPLGAARISPSPKHAKQVQELAQALSLYDCDLILLDKIIATLHGAICRNQALQPRSLFRITNDEIAVLEQLRGEALQERNKFVRANLRLVISVARHFIHVNLPLIDLIQEGNMGLIKAIHRFDHRRGFRFSTYAHWWIRQSVERAIVNKGAHIRLPVHLLDAHRLASRAAIKAAQRLGRTATRDEIAHEANITPKKLESILNSVLPDTKSLDDHLGHDDPRALVDLVQDDTPLCDEAMILENGFEHVRELLDVLTPLERDIIKRRFGLGDDNDQTLEEIGKNYHLSRERVRQIQTQTLAKLRRLYQHKYADEDSRRGQ